MCESCHKSDMQWLDPHCENIDMLLNQLLTDVDAKELGLSSHWSINNSRSVLVKMKLVWALIAI